MFADRIEGKWILMFRDFLVASGVTQDSLVGIICETQSRELNVHLAELALGIIGARSFKLVSTTPRVTTVVPTRSTGTSASMSGLGPIIRGLSPCDLILDLTIEGMLHSPELHEILATGSKALYVLNEHPEALERLDLGTDGISTTLRNAEIIEKGNMMRVTSAAGTDLTVEMKGGHPVAITGIVDKPGSLGHWPGGLVAITPPAGCANGKIVVNVGDMNCTFKRYLERPMTLHIENDVIVQVDGDGVDAELFRSYSAAWNEVNAMTTAHFGWGTNRHARWESMAMYDKSDTNGIEARTFAGNFLVGIGASHVAHRETQNHFDLPLRNTTVHVDGKLIVDQGNLCIV
jgi:2,5-dihydroxypyridine 5,6-dioxygenase